MYYGFDFVREVMRRGRWITNILTKWRRLIQLLADPEIYVQRKRIEDDVTKLWNAS
jgi:hypothetical protein